MSDNRLDEILLRLQAIENRLAIMEANESRRHPPTIHGWHRPDFQPVQPSVLPSYEYSTDPAMLGFSRGQ